MVSSFSVDAGVKASRAAQAQQRLAAVEVVDGDPTWATERPRRRSTPGELGASRRRSRLPSGLQRGQHRAGPGDLREL